MPNPRWRKNTSVIERLLEEPQLFEFTQTLRLIERSAAFYNQNLDSTQDKLVADHAVGRYSPPSKECVRFKNSSSLSFPNTEVRHLSAPGKQTERGSKQWEILTSFLGLTGSQGVLPFTYTEMLLARTKKRDPALAEFLDLFNHRTISLFYQASIKYSLPLHYERAHLPFSSSSNKHKDTATNVLRSLIGMGTKGLENRLSISDESLVYFGGLFSQQVRNSSGLTQIISHYFDVPVKLEEFQGRWQELIDDIRARLPDMQNPKGQNVCLGRSAMLGKRGWYAQGKIRVVLGPLNAAQYELFAPGGTAIKALNDICKTYLGMENEYDFRILVNRADTPDRVQLGNGQKPIMGWSTWLAGRPKNSQHNSETMTISMSAMP